MLGVVGTKFAAFNLLPLLGQPGLGFLSALMPAVETWVAKTPSLFAVPLFAIAMSWLLAFIAYLVG